MGEVTVRERLTAVVIAGVLALTAGVALARPGGGEAYSGGGGGYSGGGGGYSGGGGGGAGISGAGGYSGGHMPPYNPGAPNGNNSNPLPWLGLILAIGVVGLFRGRRHPAMRTRGAPVTGPIELDEVRKVDPAFSQIAFEDFAFRLFAAAHRARHDSASVGPYVSVAARAALAKRAPVGERVEQVIVGALRTVSFELDDRGTTPAGSRIRIGVEFEANVATAKHTYFSVERWWFIRSMQARSKPPGAAHTFPCPNCGAPWTADRTGTQRCASCNEIVDNGRFDWQVASIEVVAIDQRPPTLTTESHERSDKLYTILQRDLRARWAEFAAHELDPRAAKPALLARLHTIYGALNRAWSNRELGPVRGLVSDGLYDYLQFWIDAYRQQGLRNVLADMRITGTEFTWVARDRYFDAITIRIYATGKDVKIRTSDGVRIVGSAHQDRPYSEYWTLIRTAADPSDAPRMTETCGHCNAPLPAGHAGGCPHCGAYVIASKRDWILAKIEQADTYGRQGISSAA